MVKKPVLAFAVIALIAVLVVCGLYLSGKTLSENNINDDTTIANPASVYCVEQGFNNTIRNNPDGSQTGYCIFPNGEECEEWAYYRGECQSE